MPPFHLALEIDGDGAHPAAWRRATAAPAATFTPERLRGLATIAENAGFTLVTIGDDILPPGSGADPLGRVGAVERAAFAAAATTVLAVAPVVSTTYAEPFHVASQLATIDHIAAGRSGWVVAASPAPQAALAWGRPLVGGADAHAREAGDSVRVARDLWDSWEDNAVIRDVATSRYLDRNRLHHVDFTGETFTVKGPAIVPRPPQGQVVVFAPDGLVPTEHVDVTLVGEARRAATPRTFVEVEVALDTPRETGADRVADLDRHGPRPEHGRLRHTGSAESLVALLTELAGAVDGVRLHPLVLDEDLAVLSRLVVPALLRTGVVIRPVAGQTLRTALGLERPANRFASAAAGETR